MESEMEIVEERLKSFLGQLRTEHGILDRMVYKNKNQHRRCTYFQYLLKVRRDLRLLQTANLEEILNASFDVINGKRPRQKVQLLESLKRRRVDSGKFNFLERLLGVARLLSQMVEPMLKAATEISTLLARSFFMGFSLTILSLLARLRVLIQQILLDVVRVFNTVSWLSQKEQAVKLNQQGLEVLREYYPTKEKLISLECMWRVDKFQLVEKTDEGETKCQGENATEAFPGGAPMVQYQSLEVLLGANECNEGPKHASEGGSSDIDKGAARSLVTCTEGGKTRSLMNPIQGCSEGPKHASEGYQHNVERAETRSLMNPIQGGDEDPEHASEGCSDNVERGEATSSTSLVQGDEGGKQVEGNSIPASSPNAGIHPVDGSLLTGSASAPSSGTISNRKSGSKDKVAFISIKRPVPSTGNPLPPVMEESEKGDAEKEDPVFGLLTGGSMRSSLF